jgi:hypothetical protein
MYQGHTLCSLRHSLMTSYQLRKPALLLRNRTIQKDRPRNWMHHYRRCVYQGHTRCSLRHCLMTSYQLRKPALLLRSRTIQKDRPRSWMYQ